MTNYVNEFTFTRSFAAPGAVTLLQIAANAARPLEVIRATLTMYNPTIPPVNAQIAAKLCRKSSAATGLTAAALADLARANPTANTTGVQLGAALTGYLATGEGADGDTLAQDGYADLNGWFYIPGQDERDYVPAGGIIALKLLIAAPAGSTFYATIRYGEFG